MASFMSGRVVLWCLSSFSLSLFLCLSASLKQFKNMSLRVVASGRLKVPVKTLVEKKSKNCCFLNIQHWCIGKKKYKLRKWILLLLDFPFEDSRKFHIDTAEIKIKNPMTGKEIYAHKDTRSANHVLAFISFYFFIATRMITGVQCPHKKSTALSGLYSMPPPRLYLIN